MEPNLPYGKPDRGSRGFILIFSLIMVMAISALAVGMIFNAHTGKITALNIKNKIQGFYASDGMVTLLAQEMIDGRAKVYIDSTHTGKISGEVWDPVSGTGIQGFRSHINGHPRPDRVAESGYLGAYWKDAEGGVRWKGFILPPVTGSYTFIARSEGASAFHLSKDHSPANLSRSPLAFLDNGTGMWPTSGSGVSKPRYLEAGKRYYFEFLHRCKEGRLLGQVGWKGPDFIHELPIPGKRLALQSYDPISVYDTTNLGPLGIHFAVSSLGQDMYGLSVDSYKRATGGDTSFHQPLNQVLSLSGTRKSPPDSQWVKVLYYDFNARASAGNPEFQPKGVTWRVFEVAAGMVKPRLSTYDRTNADFFGLDSIPKPERGPLVKHSCRLDKWFRPWAPGDFMVPAYAAGDDDCTPVAAAHDRSFENVVIKDSLLFRRNAAIGPNVYDFQGTRIAPSGLWEFFPIDNRGFGNDSLDEWRRPRNFSFCMEMHSEFIHTSGMNFTFRGDDDMWLYIGDSLVLDLGYIHNQATGVVELDELTHLKFGETYGFHLYYCERLAWRSNLRITSNIPLQSHKGRASRNWSRDYGSLD